MSDLWEECKANDPICQAQAENARRLKKFSDSVCKDISLARKVREIVKNAPVPGYYAVLSKLLVAINADILDLPELKKVVKDDAVEVPETKLDVVELKPGTKVLYQPTYANAAYYKGTIVSYSGITNRIEYWTVKDAVSGHKQEVRKTDIEVR